MALDFVAIDFETANRSPASVCQVGLALVRDGRVGQTWGSLVRPPCGLDWFDPACTQVHGIVERDLDGQPSFERVWPEINKRLRGYPLVAHNTAFDILVIREATAVCDYDWPSVEYGCSLLLARRRYDLPMHTLDAVAEAAGIALVNHHDAVADALACALITIDMAQRVSAVNLDELLRFSGIAWGRLAPGTHEACHPVKTHTPIDTALSPTLF